MSSKLKVRYSVRHLQDLYERGKKENDKEKMKPLEDLVRAWKGIQELPATNKKSFFVLGGYHGEPFVYRPQVDALSPVDSYQYWGGYCNHGNVLFPTWHRVYVLKLEQALQSIVPDVTMPYWDETSQETLEKGIPWVLTNEAFELDGEMIDNPLRSFVLPEALSDDLPGDDQIYHKPKGYQTVRYPLSGLVGTEEAKAETEKHNANYPHPIHNIKLLNDNVKAWLNGSTEVVHPNPKKKLYSVYSSYEKCLCAPNYTVFSNTTSAAEWNLGHHKQKEKEEKVVSLESPHNDIHLAVGGFDGGNFEAGLIADANGDMGENNTAAMDPIFFFHHCNVDRVFWLWQKQKCATKNYHPTLDPKHPTPPPNPNLKIIKGYAGTSSTDLQGPTPGVAPNTPLNFDTPLEPFLKDEFGTRYTSRDCIDIETQLGYTYAPGSLEDLEVAEALEALEASEASDASESNTEQDDFSTKTLTVRGINRASFQGSFVLRAYATVKKESGESTEYYLGHHAVFSRHNVTRCANCLTHLEVIAHFPLSSMPAKDVDKAEYRVDIQHRGNPGNQHVAPFSHEEIEYEVRD